MAGTKLTEQQVLNAVFDETNGVLRTGLTLEGDIEIGAVELKDYSSTNRAAVTASNELKVLDSNSEQIEEAVKPASSFDHGAKSSISTTAVQITTVSTSTTKGVLVKAANANTGIIYVGNADVTRGTADLTDGMEIAAGEGTTVLVDNANKVYVIGSASGQKVFWLTV